MLLQEFTSVLQVANREELLTEIVRFTRRLNFDTVTAIAVSDQVGRDSMFTSVDNAPEAYRALACAVESARVDPVMQHCKRSSTPIIWNQDTYVLAGRGALWEEQACFGYCTGITLAFHLSDGRHFCIGVDRDQPLPDSPEEVSRMAADFQLFATHVLDAAIRVLMPTTSPVDLPNLTPREIESLRWTMEGKTAWELGRILGISEQTAARHVNNASQKLGCVSKHQAVLKALRMKLIE